MHVNPRRILTLLLAVMAVTASPALAQTPTYVTMPSPFMTPPRAPAAGLPAPVDRVGLTFGHDTSELGQLFASGPGYIPLDTAKRAGVRWVRLDADRRSFTVGGGGWTYEGYGQVVKRLVDSGIHVHIGITDYTLDGNFMSEGFLRNLEAFAAEIARQTNHPGRVVYEVWNEPNYLGLFWRASNDTAAEARAYAQMLIRVTTAIHQAVPSAVVISAGLTTDSATYADSFLPEYRRLLNLRADSLGQVQRFGFHAYPYSHDTLALFRRKLNQPQAGFSAYPIDITEVGDFWNPREVGAHNNAAILLRSIEADLPHINFWSALSQQYEGRLAGFMDPKAGEADGCRYSTYGFISGVAGYVCHPSMYMLQVFNRVAAGRTYQGAYFDARTQSMPGSLPGDDLSGVRALKFESTDDVVVAVWTMDTARGPVAGSGRTYSLAFPTAPLFVVSDTGTSFPTADSSGRWQLRASTGPLYFFFSKTGKLPEHKVHVRALCPNGGVPSRGQVEVSTLVWPDPSNSTWQYTGAFSANINGWVKRQLPSFFSSMYVTMKAADGSGRVLQPRGSALIVGPGAPSVSMGNYFDPPTPMFVLNSPSTTSSEIQLDFHAPAEWCG
ncbi:hypothetical protein HPC49_28355 [Pyxidicoccus fallax]|uniref:Glycoside hydrolase family 5 domain-containing protein n=1 Tax=Pyxidicoccus fallax TaxID=394095 RepID=A0A848LMM8_9BACT|nr:hypothetical protein [Pyxidicoccus fallax]NMO19058.1 hypothetical protein [Pyxidicoccus fallax]NPC82117.1 hypothetical protein [Pyxidicoccus fallax]